MSADGYGTENDDLYGDGDDPNMQPQVQRKKLRKKKKKIIKQVPGEWVEASLREHLLAGAYGGIAKPKKQRAGLKYTTDIDAGLRDIATPQIFRETATSGTGRKMYKPSYVNSNSDDDNERYAGNGLPTASRASKRKGNASR